MKYSKAEKKNQKNTEKKVTPVKFYGRFIFDRKNTFSTLLRSGRLYLQYLCEAFYKVEDERLAFIRRNQDEFRASSYADLHEILGDAGAAYDEALMIKKSDVGRVTVLPSTHTGGDRNMRQKMHDIIAISNKIRFPDIFLTFTCNPNWKEIQNSEDRPDLCNRKAGNHLVK